MEDVENQPALSRKELRKQKLMEYLAAKGKLKPPALKALLHSDLPVVKTDTPASKVLGGKENKAPADRLKCDDSKGQNIPSSGPNPPRGAFDDKGQINSKGSTQAGEQISNCLSLLKPNVNRGLTRTYSVVRDKPNSIPTGHLKKQTNACTFGAKPGFKSGLRPNRSASCPGQTTTNRLSVGPCVKTKTGLIPAVIQPRSTGSNRLDPPSSTTRSSSQRPQTFVPSTIRTDRKAPAQSKPAAIFKPAQIGGKSQMSSTSFRSRVESSGLEGRAPAKKLANANSQLSAQSRPAAIFKPAQTGDKSQTSGTSFRSRVEPSGLEGRAPAKKLANANSQLSAQSQPAAIFKPAQTGDKSQTSGTSFKSRAEPSGLEGRAPAKKLANANPKPQPPAQSRPAAIFKPAQIGGKSQTSGGLKVASASFRSRAEGRALAKKLASANPLPPAQSRPAAIFKPAQTGDKSQKLGGLRVASTSFRSRVQSSGLEGRAPNKKLSLRPEAGFTNQKSGANAPKTPSTTASTCSSRAATGGRRAETKTGREVNSKKENRPTYVPPQRAKTKPKPTGRDPGTRTPKPSGRPEPQTEGKKLTAAQEERMKKLQEWRESKGISYKRPPMPARPPTRNPASVPQPFWASMKAEDDAHSLICAVDRSLADCIKLLAEGCPPAQVREVVSRLPAVSQKFAKYWICRARLMEREGDLEVLPMFEEAVRVVLEPVDELRTVVFDILKKKDEIQVSEEREDDEEAFSTPGNTPDCSPSPMMTPKPTRALINGEKGPSSVVKYKITATPGGQQGEPVRFQGQEVRFFTPVRRSVRIHGDARRYPAALQDHDVVVGCHGDLQAQEGGGSPPMYVYRENEALRDKVEVRLVCEDAV
ncbi:uncharacterized protein ACNS7B_011621 [Menidia menidia]